MHEYGIACEIVSIAAAEAAKHGARKVTRIRLLVGVLRGVVADHLSFLFENAAKGSVAEGAELAIEEEPVSVSCGACGTFAALRFAISCPRCGGMVDGVSGGDALRIVSLDIDG